MVLTILVYSHQIFNGWKRAHSTCNACLWGGKIGFDGELRNNKRKETRKPIPKQE